MDICDAMMWVHRRGQYDVMENSGAIASEGKTMCRAYGSDSMNLEPREASAPRPVR